MINSFGKCYNSSDCEGKKCVRISGKARILKNFYEKKGCYKSKTW